MVNTSIKDDPIKVKFYDPIEKAEKYLKLLFWITVICSFAVPLCNRKSFPNIYNKLQIVFCLTVLLLSILDLFVRFYLKPRADDMRVKDFLSHSYEISLNHNQTVNYYNNNEIKPIRKLAAQLLENSMHSKSTTLEMAKKLRLISLVYVVIFGITIINRSTDLEIISIAAQIVFGQQIITSIIRIEWMRVRFERVFDDMSSLFQLNPIEKTFEIKTLEGLTKYETTKANGGILLSNKIFELNNQKVSNEWNQLKLNLNIL